MNLPAFAAIALLFSSASVAASQPAGTAKSESRDASVANIGGANFVVGRVARDCLSLVGSSEAPKAFVFRWQVRNTKYILASEKYLGARMAEDEAAGGVAKRNASMDELMALARRGGEGAVNVWLDRPDKLQACKVAIAIIESGAYDISPKLPMYEEHERLVQWAQE